MPSKFNLPRLFTVGSFIIIGLVAIALVYFHSRQSNFFESVQTAEIRQNRETQREAILRAEQVARRNLLSSQESAHINWMGLLSSALWASDFAPFLEQVQRIDANRCRALGLDVPSNCLATQADAIRALPSWATLDTHMRAAMRGSSVVGIRMHDLHGITIYSTEPAQIGRDASSHPGWIGAARHRKAVSEQPLPNPQSNPPAGEEPREHIVSYLPMVAPGTERVVGVFEVHTDVTALMRQFKTTSYAFQNAADDNVQRATRQLEDAQKQVERSGRIQFVVIASLLAMLYVLQLAVVRRSQDEIQQLSRERQAHQQRLVHTEKLATLGQMVASVAHQLKTPLTFSKSNVITAIQSLDCMAGPIERSAYMFKKEVAGDVDVTKPHDLDDEQLISAVGKIPGELHSAQSMLGDVLIGMEQMSELVNHLHNFNRPDTGTTAPVHLNRNLSTVMTIAKSVVSSKVRLVEAFEELPALDGRGSQLNQVFLNLIVNAAQSIRGSGTVTVSTRYEREHIVVCIVDTGCGIAKNALPRIFDPYFTTKPTGEGIGLGLTIAKSIVADHRGRITVDTAVGVGSRFKVTLPLRVGK